MIEARRVAKADGIGGGEQSKRRVRLDDLALVEQRQAAGGFQHALDHEHHVGTAGVVFVEAERDIVLQRPRQDALAEFGDLLAFLDDDGVLADQVDTADVAVEVDAHAGPIQPRRHLLDMRRLAGAVIAGDDDAAVLRKAGENGERGRAVEAIIRIDIGHVFVSLGIGRNFQVAVDAENLAGSTPSCRAGRRLLELRQSLILRGFRTSEALKYAPDAVTVRLIGGNLADGTGAKTRRCRLAPSMFSMR